MTMRIVFGKQRWFFQGFFVFIFVYNQRQHFQFCWQMKTTPLVLFANEDDLSCYADNRRRHFQACWQKKTTIQIEDNIFRFVDIWQPFKYCLQMKNTFFCITCQCMAHVDTSAETRGVRLRNESSSHTAMEIL